VLFAEAPSFAQPMEDQVVAVGSTAVMQCMTSGSPRPRLTWLKDSVVFIPTLRHFFTADDQLLVIVQTAASDAGNYTCVITNVLGSDRQVGCLHRCVLPSDVVLEARFYGLGLESCIDHFLASPSNS